MKHKNNNTIFWLTITIFSSLIQACGPSSTEIKKQEQKLIDSTLKVTEQRSAQLIDSTKKAIEQRSTQLIDSAKKVTEQKTLQTVDSTNKAKDRQNNIESKQRQRAIDKEIVKSRLSKLKSDLELQRAKLEDIEGFHFMRSPSDKEQQINDQVALINSTKQSIENLNELLEKINSGQEYRKFSTPNRH